jgi:glucokinase
MRPILTGDIGGTNARFVLFEDGVYQAETFRVIPVGDYTDLGDAVTEYLNQINAPAIAQASFSFASTHEYQDQMELTNSDLKVSVSGLVERFSLQRARIVNDFTAAAVGIVSLPADCLDTINIGHGERYGPKAVIGPGTGLGVSGLVYTGEYWLPLQSQGGHVTIGAQNDRELSILTVLEKKYGHVSAERYLSGIGTVDVYQSICAIDRINAPFDQPSLISEAAIQGTCAASIETMQLFCKWLGIVAGNLAVTLGATGGIYIAGGIVPRLGDFFTDSEFSAWLFKKGRFSEFVRDMPVVIVRSGEPALYGTHTCLQSHYDLFGYTAVRDG